MVTLASWTVAPQPTDPSINVKTPDLAAVCSGQTVSATFNAGIGGVGCSDEYQYSFDGSGLWNNYIPGSGINTTGHTQVQIQGRRSGCTPASGCTGTSWVTLATWTVNLQPTGPTLNLKIPDLGSVCAGQSVSATFIAGGGGVGCSDEYQYRFDGTGGWTDYTPGSNLNTTGHTIVDIRGQRRGCTVNSGCLGTGWMVLATWTVNPQPSGPSLNVKSPNLAAVCTGQIVSATFNPGTGGVGCTDSFEYRFDGTGLWNTYTPGSNINTTGHVLVEIQGSRSGCTSLSGCTGTAWALLASWIVNPYPVLTSTLTPPAICSGSVFSYTPASGTGGTSFGWTRATVAGITPAGPTSGSGNPNETLTNTTTAPLTVRYVYTLAANSCTNPATYNVDVVVNPMATLTSTLTPPAICSGSVFSYTPASGTGGTSFGWTRATVAGITPAGPTSGTGNPNETLTNTTVSPLTVRYVYTLTANSCTNPATYNVDVVVNPTPTLTSTPTPPAICSGSVFSYTPASGTGGTSFGWTRATVAGITPAGPTSGTGNPNETLTNTTTAPLTVRYVYTLAANSCTNPATYNVDVVVNPTPTLTSTLTPPAICSGSVFSYTPASGTVGTSFGWTRATVAGITPAGPTSGTGNPNEALTNTTVSPLTVRYVYTLAANSCTNPATYNVDVVVNPMATLTSTLTPPAICSGSVFSYTPASGTAGTSFGWTRATVAGITPAGPTSGTGNPNETLTNTTVSPLTVRYVYTLTANSCTNPATYNVDVVVNPTPTLTSTLTPPAICSGSVFSYTPTSGTGGTSFGWTRATVAGITPAGPTSGTGNPSETLTNTTVSPLTVRYVYTLTANSCTNPATYNVDVVVNPTPTLTSTLTPPAICSGSVFSYTPASGTAGTSFGWTRATVAGITPAGPTSGTGNPNETLTNTTTAPLTVRYVYTLAANSCTNPATYNVDVVVNPTPTLTSTLTPPAICSGSVFSYTPASGTAGTSFGWTRATVAGITPAGPTSGTGNPNETLTNTTVSPLTVRYVYTLAANSCTNPATYNVDVVVNPMATLTSTLTPPAICSGSVFSYTPASGTAGTSFGWTRATVAGITPAGPTSGTGNPDETLTNTTVSPLTVRYVYTLTANSCTNPATYNVDVVVNPTPTLTSTLTPPAICSGSVFSYTPTSGTGGTSFGWTRATVAGITPAGPTSGTGNPNETLTNTTVSPLTVRYVYTLTANSCTNPATYNVDVVVNPTPTLTSTLTPPAICSGSVFSYTPASGTAGTSFGWTRATVAGITPAGPTSGSGNPNETLTNTTVSPLTVRYVYTLTANSCTNPATYNVDVVVNPTPTLTSTLTPPAICSGSVFSYTPASGTAGTSFGWTRATVAGITPAGPTSGTGNPNETLTNTTVSPLTVRYVYTLTANSCTNPATYNVDVVVNPTPTLTSTLTPPAICSGSVFSYTPASGTAGTSFGWTRATVAGITPAGPTSGSGNPNETLTNTTVSPLTVRYVYTLTANSCTNPATYNVDVVVNPTPTLTSTLTPPAICSGSVFSYTPASGTAGTSFGWTRASVAGITPAGPTSGTGNPNETLTNTTVSPLTVRYVYILTANGCTNPASFNVDVTVNPTAVITSDATANWCNNVDNTYTATSSSSTATFAWDRSAVAGISNAAASGTGAVITETLINTTTEPVVVHYLITPSVNGCAGTQFDLSVTVNPTAVITSDATASWCNNVENTYTATSSSSTATFAWDRAAVAGISNAAASGTGAIITETLINTTTEPVVVHYLITPSVNGCAGTQFDLSVTVNPTAVITSDATASWCNNVENTYTATSSSSTATFTWDRAAVAGISNAAASGTGAVITETLINTTAEPVVVHYLITPSVNGCAGTQFDLSVTVNPTAVITSDATANWCNNVENTYTATSSSSTATFAWDRAAVAGISNAAASGTGAIITETLINTTTEPVVVHYLITPSVNGCAGTQFDLSVTVNPTAVITSDATASWCNNVENTYTATSSSSTATFTWDRAAVAGISNAAASGTGAVITETLINTTAEPVVVHYLITPSVNGCAGTQFDLSVTVNPTAVITSDATANWCNNVENTYTATSSSSTATFAWDRAAVAGISNAAASGTGAVITETLINTTAEPVVVHYLITPSVNGCTGTQFDLSVTVNPTAVITSDATANWCNNVENTYTATSSSSTATFTWDRAAVAGISNAAASGTGAIITETLINTTTEPVVVHYLITPSVNGCAGTQFDLSVTVNPTAVITSDATASWCNNVENTYTATSSSSTATFAWDRAAVAGISNAAASGTGAIITETLINTTTEPVVVHYLITPSVNGCAGTQFDLSVTVNPTAVITSDATASWCNNVENTYTATSSSSTATFAWDRAAVAGISNAAASGTGAIITETLINTTTEPVVVHYLITPSVNGCSGTQFDLSVTVNPTAVITSDATASWCNNVENTYTATSSSSTATFAWDRAAVAGISNAAASGTGAIITETLINTTTEPVVVHYLITPSVNGCAGTQFDLSVTVNPTPEVNQPDSPIFCNGLTTDQITFTSPNTGGIVTYTWTNNQPSIGILATGEGDILPFTALNPGTSPVVATIEVTPHFTNGSVTCDGLPKTFTITVNPTAQVEDINPQVVCNDASTLTVEFKTINSVGITTYTWINDLPSIGLAAGGTGDIPAFTAVNTGDAPVIATITVTPHFSFGGITCDGPSKTFTITVDPTPQVVPSTLTQMICNYGVTNIVIGSPSSFTNGSVTFDYTVTATGGVTGFTTPVTGLSKDYVIEDTLINPTDGPQTVTYTIVPVTSAGCASGPAVVVVTVLPTAKVDQPSDQVLCNGEDSAPVLLSTLTVGVVVFTWTNDQPSIGLAPSGTGDIPSFTAVNSGDSPVVATIRVTPHFTYGTFTCDGQPKIFTITVNPTPQVVPVVAEGTICDDGTTGITLTSPSTFSNGVITFRYTVVATGGVTGFTTPVTGLPLGHVITDVLNNPTDAPQTVTYTIYPVNPSGSCSEGPAQVVVITVNPTPQVVPVVAEGTICDDGTTGITLTSPSTFSNGVITFRYTVVATGGVTGFTTPVTGLPLGHVITDVLNNPTDAPQTVTYTIYPVNPSGSCSEGPAQVVVITVNPTPQVVPVVAEGTICDDGTTGITLTSPSTFSNGVITFRYTVVATGGVTGFTTPVTGLPLGHVITDVLNNPTDAPQTVTYTIYPVNPSGSCSEGPAQVVVITVNPTPQVVPVVAEGTICDDGTTGITLTSPSTFSNGVITFRYTVVATGGVTGFTTPVTGLPLGHVITDVLNNPTDAPQTVTYTIYPVNPSGSCSEGPAQVVVITVNPTPQVVPVVAEGTICNDGTTGITLTSPSTFSNGLITFRYTVVATGGVTGFTTPVTGLPLGHVITDVLNNPTDAPQTVTYTIYPVNPSGSCSEGPAQVVVITVNPTPQVVPVVAEGTICDDGTTGITLTSPSTFSNGLITFRYTVVATGGVTGFTTPVTGLPLGHVITDVLNNPTDAPQTVTYTIYPVNPSGSCSEGPAQVVVITVNPTPQVVPVVAEGTICNDGTTGITLTSPSTFSNGLITFRYTVVATGGVTGYTTPVTGLPLGHVITDVLNNPTDAPQTVTYTIYPVNPSGSCSEGPAQVVVITVNPTPQVVPVVAEGTICDDGTTGITLTSPSTFSNGVITFRYTVVATGGVTGFTTPVTGLPLGHVITDVLNNPTDAPQTVTYTIYPVNPSGSCSEGPAQVVVITVNPTPQVVPVVAEGTICDDGTTGITLTSPSTFSNGVITFRYTVVATGGVTGFTTPVTGLPLGHVITDVLNNPTDAPQTVTYTIYPVNPSGSCSEGPAQVVVITVNPTPQVVPVVAEGTICDDGTTGITLTSPSTFSNGVITFRYTVVATGGVTGFTTPVTGLPLGHVITDVLNNPTDAPQTVTYTIYPVNPSGSCSEGPAQVVVITVNPTPQVVPVVAEGTICDDGTTGITLTSPSTFSNGVITFRYTVVATGGVTGFTTPVTGLPLGHVITDVLNNPTDAPQTVTYTIYPVNPSGSCSEGPAQVVVITVNPTPQVVPVVAEGTICNDGTTGITLTSPSTFSNGVITFRYTVVATGGVTGFTTPVTGLPLGHVITDVLNNPTDAPQTVTYTIYPVNPSGSCSEGPAQVVVITINPTPRIFPVPAVNIRCDNTSADIVLQSPSTFTSGVVTIDFTATAPAGLSGYTTNANGLANGYIITDNLVNITDAPLTVTYTVTPLSGAGCNNGPSVDINVTVNPTPRATPANAKPAICYGGNTQITLNSPTIMTSGEIKFDYTISIPAGVTGNSNPENDKSEGNILSFIYRNYNDTVGSVWFSITPKVTGLNCPAGNISMQEVQLHPKPVRGITITEPYTCETGIGLAALRADISRGAGPYDILWTGPVGYVKEDSIEIKNLYAGYYTLDVTDNLGCIGDTSINIANLSSSPRIIPQPILPNINVSCPGGNDGTARIYVRDGLTYPYTYWFIRNDIDTVATGVFTGNYDFADPLTYRICTGLMAGQYKLVVNDINGCETYRPGELKEPAPILISFDISNFNGSNISCRGYNDGSAAATVTGGNGSYTYFWYSASGSLSVSTTTNVLDSIPAGKYYLRVTDLLGCIKTDSVTLIDPPGMVLTASEVSQSIDGNFEISCNGASDGYIKLTIHGGSGNYTYLWVGPDGYLTTTKDISGLKAGLYTCTVTDINGCVLMPQPVFSLSQPDLLAITSVKSVSADGSYNITCFGGTGAVDVTVIGGSTGSYTYNWTTSDGAGISQGQQDQNSLRAGTYHLVVTDANGCIATADIVLTQPLALVTELIPSHITCQVSGFNNGSINLNVSGGIGSYSYLWSTGAITQDISGLSEGYYSVRVTDTNGCQKTDSARIDLPPPLTFAQVLSEYNGFNISCNGKADGSILINPTSGTPPYIFSWQGPQAFTATTKDISGLKAGQYIILVTDSNLCSVLDTINLTEPEKLSMIITPSVSITGEHNINCADGNTGSVSLTAVNYAGTADYLWADGATGSFRAGLKPGDYKIIITDSNGCSADSSVTLTAPDSIRLSFSVTQPFCTDMPDGEILLNVTGGTNAGYAFLWSDNSTTQNISTAVSGIYSVTVTDMNSCSVSDSVMIHPENEICLEIPNAISPNGDLINDEWNIGLKDLYPEIEITIFNRWGEMIWKSERGYPLPWDGRSKGSVLPIDSYHYIIDLNNGTRPIIGHITIVK